MLPAMRVLSLSPAWFLALSTSLSMMTSGCGSAMPAPEMPAEVTPRTLQGEVSFATRSPTPRGASERIGRGVMAHVPVVAVDGDGNELGRTITDASGRFSMESTSAATHLQVVARLQHDGHDLAVTTHANGEPPHIAAVAVTADAEQNVHFPDEVPMSGALHILASMFQGSVAVRDWTGHHLPPFFCYWSRGETTNWSFYTGERGDTGRFTIELLGGEPNARAITDTDEHDEAIILHEFGHFVMDRLSSSSSHGGSHPRGALIDPGLAWEEGRATWFAATVLGNGWYQDTIGLEPRGELRVHHDVEQGIRDDVRGVGSESGVSEILWDLADGVEGLPDRDEDGVALGPGGVLEAMVAMGQQPGAFPTIETFLHFLMETNRVTEEQLRHVLIIGRHPVSLLEDSGTYPRALTLGDTITGKIDTITTPSPHGGRPRAGNGQDAVNVFRFHLDQPGRVSLTLSIGGSGGPADHTDLDLELRDIRSDSIASSNGEGPRESIISQLEAGYYIVYVRDGGQPTRADYRLETSISH